MNTPSTIKQQDALAAMEQLDELLTLLGQQPDKRFIKKNQYADDAEYLPIGYIQAKLDQIFRGLWSEKVIHQATVANGYTMTVEISVYNWVANVWITRVGTAAIPFMMEKNAHPMDLNKLKPNGIKVVIPIVKSIAVKNAVSSLGNIFGRNLNREFKHGHAAEKGIKEILNKPINE